MHRCFRMIQLKWLHGQKCLMNISFFLFFKRKGWGMMITWVTSWHFVYIFKARLIYSSFSCYWDPIRILLKSQQPFITIKRLAYLIWNNLKIAFAVMAFYYVVDFAFEKRLISISLSFLCFSIVFNIISHLNYRTSLGIVSDSWSITLCRFGGCPNRFNIHYGRFCFLCLKSSTFCPLFWHKFHFWSSMPWL